ncbi:hypothetical protein GRI40_10320 [Altererythrobacter aerius]|uniref:Terminase n=1 Tax=Tsuneonella aeria TaxID=1837929 RepID=A0A6I4THS4_9SPHN|nr:hypothetical protein [Tsuneonella aeria]MXO75610.1 hypothetical protein [Tsuneonella aeria]
MSDTNGTPAPAWAARFIEALRAGRSVRQATREAGVSNATPYRRRETDADFREAWDACAPVDDRGRRASGPRSPRGATKVARFLQELALTSNVAAAAAVADLPTARVYALRRSDPEFAKAWYAALAEGYDNLEMELLAHLRSAGEAGGGSSSGEPGRKFDTATALRCLTAHRESVARERGRRTLADEVTTIASINAKIDALRARAKEGEQAIRAARKAAAAGRSHGDDQA